MTRMLRVLIVCLMLAGSARTQVPSSLQKQEEVALISMMEAAGGTLFSLNKLGLLQSGQFILSSQSPEKSTGVLELLRFPLPFGTHQWRILP